MQITIESRPATLAELDATAPDMMQRPEGTAALLIAALMRFVEDRDAGTAMLNYLQGPRPLSEMDAQFIADRLSDKTYLPAAYGIGATPDNAYTPQAPLRIEVLPDPNFTEGDETARVFVATAGADSPRPVTLRRKRSGSTWYAWEYASLLSGIRTPTEADPWA
ncbi:MAG: DUF6935 domain-containing protein [Saccharofermentanales bacterium]|jgi:hypothetical protein